MVIYTLLLSDVLKYEYRKLAILHSFIGAFAEMRNTTSSVFMSVRPSFCPHVTTQLPLNGFS